MEDKLSYFELMSVYFRDIISFKKSLFFLKITKLN